MFSDEFRQVHEFVFDGSIPCEFCTVLVGVRADVRTEARTKER